GLSEPFVPGQPSDLYVPAAHGGTRLPSSFPSLPFVAGFALTRLALPEQSPLKHSPLLYLEAENFPGVKCSLFRRKYLIPHFSPQTLRPDVPLCPGDALPKFVDIREISVDSFDLLPV